MNHLLLTSDRPNRSGLLADNGSERLEFEVERQGYTTSSEITLLETTKRLMVPLGIVSKV